MFVLFLFMLSLCVTCLAGYTPPDGLIECVIAPAVGAALIGAGANLFGGLFGSADTKANMETGHEYAKDQMRYQYMLGRRAFDYQFGREAGLNQQLMENSPAIQKGAMIRAGINPASEFGTFGGNLAQASMPSFSASSPSPQGQPLSFGELAQIPILEQQYRNLKADADSKERENRAKQEEDDVYANFNNYFTFDVHNGKLEIKMKDGNQLPDTFSTNLHTRTGVEAMHLSLSRILKEQAENNADISQAQLKQAVAIGQLRDNSVLQALISMPEVEYKKAREEWYNLIKEGTLKGLDLEYYQKRNNFELPEQKLQLLEHEIKSKTNIVGLIERFSNGSWTTGDLIYSIIMGFSGALGR